MHVLKMVGTFIAGIRPRADGGNEGRVLILTGFRNRVKV